MKIAGNQQDPADISPPSQEVGAARFEVLIVEDDPASLREYVEALEGLGYSCRNAANGAEALKLVAQHANIGVVMTDIDMPGMDGLTLLGELQARFTPFRPLVPLVVTGLTTLETAVEAMRSDATDYLQKPVTPQRLAVAMRRAATRWAVLFGQFRLGALTASGHAAVFEREPKAIDQSSAPDKQTLLKFVRSIQKSRLNRGDFIDTSLFSDPAWDILLDLTSAALEGRTVPVSSVCAAADAPLTTASRHVRELVASGMVKRWNDPSDKRRSLVALESGALEAMLGYITHVWTAQTKIANAN